MRHYHFYEDKQGSTAGHFSCGWSLWDSFTFGGCFTLYVAPYGLGYCSVYGRPRSVM